MPPRTTEQLDLLWDGSNRLVEQQPTSVSPANDAKLRQLACLAVLTQSSIGNTQGIDTTERPSPSKRKQENSAPSATGAPSVQGDFLANTAPTVTTNEAVSPEERSRRSTANARIPLEIPQREKLAFPTKKSADVVHSRRRRHKEMKVFRSKTTGGTYRPIQEYLRKKASSAAKAKSTPIRKQSSFKAITKTSLQRARAMWRQERCQSEALERSLVSPDLPVMAARTRRSSLGAASPSRGQIQEYLRKSQGGRCSKATPEPQSRPHAYGTAESENKIGPRGGILASPASVVSWHREPPANQPRRDEMMTPRAPSRATTPELPYSAIQEYLRNKGPSSYKAGPQQSPEQQHNRGEVSTTSAVAPREGGALPCSPIQEYLRKQALSSSKTTLSSQGGHHRDRLHQAPQTGSVPDPMTCSTTEIIPENTTNVGGCGEDYQATSAKATSDDSTKKRKSDALALPSHSPDPQGPPRVPETTLFAVARARAEECLLLHDLVAAAKQQQQQQQLEVEARFSLHHHHPPGATNGAVAQCTVSSPPGIADVAQQHQRLALALEERARLLSHLNAAENIVGAAMNLPLQQPLFSSVPDNLAPAVFP